MDENLRIRIYSIKTKYKVTIKTIADAAGINYSLLSQCLSGKKHFPQKHLQNLIKVLDKIDRDKE
mgnify:CR=1 FL=1